MTGLALAYVVVYEICYTRYALQTVESVMCVLRNLSYQLESEVDLQDGAEDVLDRDWEAEQRRDLEDFSAARY